jgi:hypothetical protein
MNEKNKKQSLFVKLWGHLKRVRSDDFQRVLVGVIWLGIYIFLFSITVREKHRTLAETSKTLPKEGSAMSRPLMATASSLTSAKQEFSGKKSDKK